VLHPLADRIPPSVPVKGWQTHPTLLCPRSRPLITDRARLRLVTASLPTPLLPAGPLRGGQPAAIGIPHSTGTPPRAGHQAGNPRY
jgi:hypothetical protein